MGRISKSCDVNEAIALAKLTFNSLGFEHEIIQLSRMIDLYFVKHLKTTGDSNHMDEEFYHFKEIESKKFINNSATKEMSMTALGMIYKFRNFYVHNDLLSIFKTFVDLYANSAGVNEIANFFGVEISWHKSWHYRLSKAIWDCFPSSSKRKKTVWSAYEFYLGYPEVVESLLDTI